VDGVGSAQDPVVDGDAPGDAGDSLGTAQRLVDDGTHYLMMIQKGEQFLDWRPILDPWVADARIARIREPYLIQGWQREVLAFLLDFLWAAGIDRVYVYTMDDHHDACSEDELDAKDALQLLVATLNTVGFRLSMQYEAFQ